MPVVTYRVHVCLMPSFSLFNEILIKLKKKVYLSIAPNDFFEA